MVELHRALEENGVCRSPLLDGHHSKQEASNATLRRRTYALHTHGFLHALVYIQHPSVPLPTLNLPPPARSPQRPLPLPHVAGRVQLVGLYQLHIQHTEVPPNFAVLLQLRELLGLGTAEAEQIEADVLHQAEAFSI